LFTHFIFHYFVFVLKCLGSAWAQQANKMDRGFLEPEQMHLLNPVLIIVLLPIFTQYLYPCFPRLTSLRKIGLGMVFSASAFLCSYFVQVAIDDAKPDKISIAWQIPQFTLDVVAELLISVTGLTYAYQLAPPQMKSVISACWGLTNSFGNLLTAAGVGSLSKIFARDPHPEQKIALFFTGLMAVNVIIYSLVALYSPDDSAPKEESTAKPSNSPADAKKQNADKK
jgi:dipeptide/tripeptide permease